MRKRLKKKLAFMGIEKPRRSRLVYYYGSWFYPGLARGFTARPHFRKCSSADWQYVSKVRNLPDYLADVF